jgi:hypothetical protein
MTVSRPTLPSEFFDRTSSKLLKQPEPQYFFCMMAHAADARCQLQTAGLLGLPGRAIGGAGAPYSDLDRLILASESEMSGAIVVEEELGKGPGHSIRINRPAFSGGGYTEASRATGASTAISTTAIDVSGEQMAITLARFVGPFAASGSVPQPYAVDAMDAQLAVHKLTDIVGLHLRRDRMKWLDTVLMLRFDAASTNVLYVGSAAADDDYTTVNSGPCDAEALFRVEETLATANIPTFSNGRWKMALAPRALRQLKTDSVYAAYSQYHADGKNPLFPGYVTTLGRLDLYEVNTLNAVANNSAVSVKRNVAFGPGAVGMGIGKRPQVQPSTDDNYGETAKVIWCSYEGFETLDERFLVSLRTS